MGARVDHRGDIYSAALVIYLLVAGRGPFDHIRGDDLLLAAHAIEDAEPASKLSVTPVPPELDAALAKALQKDPADRFQTVVELLERLESVRNILLHSPKLLETRVYAALSAPEQEPEPVSDESRPPSTADKPSASRALSLPTVVGVFFLALASAAVLGAVLVSIVAGSLR